MKVVILASARKHGIATEDMLHAFRNPIRTVIQDSVSILIGPNTHGNLIEVGVVTGNSQLNIIHAMKARKKFLK